MNTDHLKDKHKHFRRITYYNSSSKTNSIENLITKIENTQIDITGDYPEWFKIGCSIASELGEGGRELFHRESRFSPKYDPNRLDKEYTKILRKNYTDVPAAYLFKVAKQHGILLKEK